MPFGSSNVIITKSKAIYSSTLKEKELNALSEKKTLAEFVGTLKTFPQFAETLSNIPEQLIRRSQLEDILKKISYQQILKIIKYAEGPHQAFYFTNIISLEINYLLKLFLYFISQEQDKVRPIDDIPSFVQRHSTLPFRDIALAKDLNSLMHCLLSTRYQSIITPFLNDTPETLRYTELEHALYVYEYEIRFSQIQHDYHGKEKKNLTMMYQTKLDLENLAKIYRLKKFYQADANTIQSVLFLKYSNIKKAFWDEILQIKDPEAVLTHFHHSAFAKIKDQDEYVFIEFDIDKIKYNLAKRFLYFSTSAAEVFAAFTILEEIEQINLTNIIEGIRYNLDSGKIKRMLIY